MSEYKVLTAADIEKLTAGNHRCDGKCGCSCTRVYDANWQCFLTSIPMGHYVECKCKPSAPPSPSQPEGQIVFPATVSSVADPYNLGTGSSDKPDVVESPDSHLLPSSPEASQPVAAEPLPYVETSWTPEQLKDFADKRDEGGEPTEHLKRIMSQSAQPVAAPTPEEVERLPKQYQGRWSYEYNEKRQCFQVCTGGYCVAETEDSEVADYICNLNNRRDYTASLEARQAALVATLREVEQTLNRRKHRYYGMTSQEVMALLSRIRTNTNSPKENTKE